MSNSTVAVPPIIQGGMGVGVSSWQLAGAVAGCGQLGVVSGTALDVVYARRLQLGDPDGHVRRAFAQFPAQAIARRVLDRYFVDGGKPPETPYRGVPMVTLKPSLALQELTVLASFAEVWLAKEHGCGGPVGINFLQKIALPLLPALYGALLAGVDCVIVGAGNPAAIPRALRRLAAREPCSLPIKVLYASAGSKHEVLFSPRELAGTESAPIALPRFLAIVSSVDLARALAADPETRPDGFIIEALTAGGHNAPPRGPLRLDPEGQPTYGDRDVVDLSALADLGLPFWLAGSYGRPDALADARALGAAGIQVGTAFAFCRESGLAPSLKQGILDAVREGAAEVFTDPCASPTGFPFKVVRATGATTLGDPATYAERERVCDVGMLRTPFETDKGGIGYRCPAEPERLFEHKRGRPLNARGRLCLCNGLLANIGLGQVRKDGRMEIPLVTAGADLVALSAALGDAHNDYGAAAVVDMLLGSSARAALTMLRGTALARDG